MKNDQEQPENLTIIVNPIETTLAKVNMTTYEVIITARNPFPYPINIEIMHNTSSWNVNIPPRETKTLNYTIQPKLGIETTIPPAYMEYFDFQHNVTVTFASDAINFTPTGIEIKGNLSYEISDYVKVNLSITNLVNITNGTFSLKLIGNETFEYNVSANLTNVSLLTAKFGPTNIPEGDYIGILTFAWDDNNLTVDARNMRKTLVGCYIGAYLGCGSEDLSCESISGFNRKMGKPHAIFVRYVDIKDSKNQSHWEWAEEVKRNGAMPMFIYDQWEGLDKINTSDVEHFAEKCKEFNDTVFIVFGHEMNGPWYPWRNDPVNYTNKFKEVAEIFHREAPNVEMCWVPNQNWGYPWSSVDYGDGYSEYYPEGTGTYGEYVDWVGLIYEKDWDEDNLIPPDMFVANIRNGQDGIDFYETFAVGKNKPMLIAETGAFDPNKDPTAPGERNPLNETEQAEFKNEWLKQVYNVSTLKEEFSRLNTICYFHANKTESICTKSHSFYDIIADYRIPKTPNVYKDLISDPYFIGGENQPPIASFTYTPQNPFVNETITFNASSSYDPDGFIVNYTWNFGDGNTTNTTEPIITHSYNSAGNYAVNLTVTDNDGMRNSTTKTITISEKIIFDTGASANPYPSISGNHTGTIKPNHTVIATKLYTYPCEGTGGHTEYAIWNSTWSANAHCEGYAGDWHNITDKTVVLMANETYFYEIRTGSYPLITTLTVPDGEITCVKFTDANGRIYKDWIPAIIVCLM